MPKTAPKRKPETVNTEPVRRLQVTIPERLWKRVHQLGGRGSRYETPSGLITAILDEELERYDCS